MPLAAAIVAAGNKPVATWQDSDCNVSWRGVPLWTEWSKRCYRSVMGRPREFQEDRVIADALQAFWRQGYGGTSIPDLIAATKLERSSLYQAFGDKHSLFDRTLETYLRAGRSAMRETLASSDPPIVKLRHWLEQVHAGCSGAQGGPGCLAVIAMVELAPSDPAIRTRLARHWAIIERALERLVIEGQAAGQFRGDMPPKALAGLVVRTIAGIAVFSRQGNLTNVSETLLSMVSRTRQSGL
jgi:AcrR family transcriptional regulator